MPILQVTETTIIREGAYYVHRGRCDCTVLVRHIAVDDRTHTDQVIYCVISGPDVGSVRSSSTQRFALLYKSSELTLN